MDRRGFLAATAAAPLVVGVAPALARTAGGTPLALVTADLESHVVAVDVSAGRVVRRLRTPPDPRSIESIGVVGALVAHTAEGRLTLIDADLRVRPIRGDLAEPRYTAVSPDQRLAYVTDSGRHELAVVDLRGRRIVGRVVVRGPCRHLGIDRAGSRLWVALGSVADELAVLSLAEPGRPRVVGRIRPPFRAHDVAFTPAAAESGSRPATAGGSRSTRQTGSSSARSPPTRRPSTSPSWEIAPSSRAETTPCYASMPSTAGGCARPPSRWARTTSKDRGTSGARGAGS